MACTDAVETEIDRHYAEQLDALGDEDPEFAADIARIPAPRNLSIAKRAREHGAAEAIGYPAADRGDPCRHAGWQSGFRNGYEGTWAAVSPALNA